MGASSQTLPRFVCVGSVIIDDIVRPDGHVTMEVLGGGGTHAAAGMTVWQERPALIACLGAGIPDSARQRIEASFDTQGLRLTPMPQARAWQIFEWDGLRRELPRVADFGPFLREPRPPDVPQHLAQVPAVSVLRDDGDMRLWRSFFPDALMLWEPEQAYMIPANRDSFITTLPLTQIVSPNLLEAQSLYGLSSPDLLVEQLIADGAETVALRMGSEGSLLGQRGQPDLVHIPAVPVPEVIDQTGAGNSYCGGFLVGASLYPGDLARAGCYGATAASFALETVGVLAPFTEAQVPLRDERFAWAMAHAQ